MSATFSDTIVVCFSDLLRSDLCVVEALCGDSVCNHARCSCAFCMRGCQIVIGVL